MERTLLIIPNSISVFLRVLMMSLLLVLVGCDSSSSSADKEDPETPGTDKDEVFTIAILPDTQYYTAEKHGGTIEMFQAQIDWIKDNYETRNIQYVAHLGDLVDHGETRMVEWKRASEVMYQLEEPVSGFPDGIPYGIAVGNHDQQPIGNPAAGGTQNGYSYYFGKDRFEGREYYGGAYSGSGNAANNNDNHFDLFKVNGEKFLVMYLEYNEPGHDQYHLEIEAEVMEWAQQILKKYSDHKAIVVSHSILKRPEGSISITTGGEGDNSIASEFTNQGMRIYEGLKESPNVFLMLCGHRSGEGFRRDTYNGQTIKTYLSDYQSREDEQGVRHGGGGLMRLMEFNQTQNTLTVRTFSPGPSEMRYESDQDSFFTMPLYE